MVMKLSLAKICHHVGCLLESGKTCQLCAVLLFIFIDSSPPIDNIQAINKVSKAGITVRGSHLTATGNHMPYEITQCYLPPDRGDFPAFTPAKAGTRFMTDDDKIYVMH